MIFSNKKRLKIFIVIGLIFLFIFACSHGVFAYTTDATPTDAEALMNYQLALQESMISHLRYLYQSKPSGFSESTFKDLCDKLYYFNVFVSPGNYQGNPNSTIYEVFTYNMASSNNADIFTTPGEWSVGITSGTAYPCMIGDVVANHFYKVVQGGGNRTTPVYVQANYTFHLPDACYLVRSTYIDEFLTEMGYYNKLHPTTYSTSDQELQAITRSGFNNLNNSINNQTSQMTNSINDASTSITNSVDNLNNTITDTTTDDSQVQLAHDNNQDLTNGFFTGLYNSIEDAFTDNGYKYVQFPIPFTNKSITWSSSYVLNNIKRNSKFSVLVSLAESVWWFGLGYFVLLDIYKKINAIKSGDLTNIENENITTNLL